ncbi:3'(2'),5'-bisphosphate nucleotidase CysQ [Candidatus Nitronereus thalassa]|uniref:3'(2'),5'-bisphosphate nucleotidase CysQ n=1 Tax=Candidatus Nitronereus thalassa TaxID=3020898 RepID=A0ABU3KCS3_9BACT|nr:3'(2'),5'-bisphosphate nucleotidase CysQ [Candidatus Nitronereus thalassa]MDT7044220.1 3'(2'),5'-bisphosphate nucleotidase CysQ [Candidatus Nitronereus thalassa]
MNTELDIVLDAVKQAGARTLELAENGFETHRKADRSPVTSADLAVNQILHDTLSKQFPNDGWMSEESPDTDERLQRSRVWIIDPIDGTSYFIKGIPQYSISVALIENQEPILGVIYNPATEELFSALKGQGLHLNGKPVTTNALADKPLRILVNPSRLGRKEFKALEAHATLQPMGSIAYSLALVAAGQADGTINYDQLHEWDIAAGWLLVQEGQGIVTDSFGKTLPFNQPDPISRGVLATRQNRHKDFETLLTKRPEKKS